jgi:PAS domain S-box-containing protein
MLSRILGYTEEDSFSRGTYEGIMKNTVLFRQVVELTNDGIWLLGPDQKTTYVNPKMIQMIGYSSEELVGRHPIDFVAPEMRDLLAEKMKRRRAGISESYDIKFKKKDGTELWVIISSSPVYDENGSFEGAIAIHTDITEKKTIQDQIEKNEIFLSSLIDNIPALVYVKSIDGKYMLTNRAYEKFVNKDGLKILGMREIDFLPPDLVKQVLESDRITLETKRSAEYEQKGHYPTGDRYFRTVKFPLLDGDNNVYAICGLTSDETERRRITKDLDQSTERFRQMAENVGEIFWLVSRENFKIEYISPAFEKIWGISQREILENPTRLLGMIEADDQKFFSHPFSELEKKGKYDTQFRIVRPDGTRRWIWNRSFGIYDDAGYLHKLCGVATDITRQKQAELLLESQKSQMLATAKMSSLGEMAAGIAHEVNNPLTIINLLATQLRERVRQGTPVSTDEMIDRLTRIEKTTERIARIVNGLRTFSRDGTADPIQTTKLETIITDTLNLCTERFKGHSVHLSIGEIPEDLTIECKPIQISQVLLNLLNNAFDAVSTLEDRSVHVEIIDRDNRILIQVTDSGHGIQSEVANRLFQPFFTTKEAGKGTGLGLSISRGIIEDHAGTLSIDTTKKNTCFVIDIPKKRREAK